MSAGVERLSAALADRYRIERELGQGGMATVYLAEDLKHHRNVAIKVLHPELSAVLGPERFLKEIELTANLQHPHILPLFDSGNLNGLLFYVMPFVEGETLRNRLEREHQLPIADAVRIASEVADALEYAHKRNVIHRDIKPENILLHDGRPLVADFGIALAVQQAGGSRMTQTGISLGTPQYMAPEQAMGDRGVDARADIYALGVVTYEMLVGESPFAGLTAQAIVAKVMTEDPRPLIPQRRSIPPHVEDAVLLALEKLPADRWRSAREFGAGLTGELKVVSRSRKTHATRADGPHPDRLRRRLTLLLAIPLLAAVAAAGWLAHRPKTGGSMAPVQFEIQLDSGSVVTGFPAISPDGRTVAFWAQRADGTRDLLVRSADNLAVRRLVTDADGSGSNVFFSPDGAWVGFVAGGNLQKVAVAGGVPSIIARVTGTVGGASWAEEDVLYGDEDGVIYRVSAAGGIAKAIVQPDSGVRFGHPQMLPGGQRLLLTRARGIGVAPTWGVYDLRQKRQSSWQPGGRPYYLNSGAVVYGDANSRLVTQDVDAKTFQPSGEPRVLADSAQPDPRLGVLYFAASPTGSLVVRHGRGGGQRLVLLDRSGHASNLLAEEGASGVSINIGAWAPRFSPDGRKVVFGAVAPQGTAQDIWIFDRDAGTTRRLTIDAADNNDGQWSPDGRWIAYSSSRDSVKDLYIQPADGSGKPRLVLHRPNIQWSSDWTPDGRNLVFTDVDPFAHFDIWTVGVDGNSPSPWFATQFNEIGARISPDGHWAAYSSNETGRNEVYLQSFPTPGSKIVVSVGGGAHPVWRHDGKELYYWAGSDLIAVTLAAGNPPVITRREKLFSASYAFGPQANYDVDPTGRFFVAIIAAEANPVVVVKLNALAPSR